MKYKPADRLTLGWQRQAGVGSLALGKSKEIWKCKNNQNQYFPLVASNPHLKRPRTHLWGINAVSRLLSTNRTLPSLENLETFIDLKNHLSNTVGQIAVGGRTWSWKFDINLTNIIGFHPRVRPHSSFSASKTKNPMFPFLPFVVFFSNC